MRKLLLAFSAIVLSVSFSIGQIITTIAGSAPPNGVSAISIGMNIFGTIADKHGNLYVSDAANSVVRKVNLATDIATIIAGNGISASTGDGGPALNASLAGPADLALDTAGNLYIGSNYANTIRKIDISTGIITTVVGTGIAGFAGDGNLAVNAEINGESGIAFDKYNNMYIADFNNSRVRKVTAATGIITTIAGTATAGYNGDNRAATTAELNYPAGVCADDSGNVFIAEQSNYRVRKIEWNTGIITTIAGNGTPGYNGNHITATTAELYCPLSVKIDKANNLYIADWGNCMVREINPYTGLITTVAGNGVLAHNGDGGLATAAGLDYCYSVALDTVGDLFVVEGFNPVTGANAWIREVDATTQIINTIVGNGSPGDYNGDGITATSAQLLYPSGVITNAAGNIFIADMGNDRIRVVDAGGTIFTYGGNGNPGYKNNVLSDSAELYNPSDIAFDKTGNMYIADFYNDMIRKIDINDSMSDFAGNGFNSPYGGAYSGNGVAATSAELYFPGGVAVDDSGSVYIADMYNNRIRKVNWKTGIITTIAGNGTGGYGGDGAAATSAKLNYPMGVAVDDSGNIFIADYYNSRVREVRLATGIITTVAGTGTASYNGDGIAATTATLNYPEGVSFDKYGVLYISDSYNYRIRAINPVTHLISTVAGAGSAGFSGDGGLAVNAQLNAPQNVAFDATGNMYIADTYNNRIRKVTGVVGLGIDKSTTVTTQVKVYPNPSNGLFNIVIASEAKQSYPTIEIYNILGEKVHSQLSIHTSQFTIDLSSNSAGVYLYRVLNEDGSLMGEGKMVIQK